MTEAGTLRASLKGRALSSTSLQAAIVAGAALLGAQPASAQSASDPDARYALIGPGSVDPQTGKFSYEATDLSVGTGPFPGTIELKRWTRATLDWGLNRPLGDFDHNFEISTTCDGFQSSAPTPCYGRRLVRVGPNAYLFTLTPDNTWKSSYGEGAGLVEDLDRFIFRGPQGDQIIFPKASTFYNHAGTVNLASSWQMANGESLTFTYEVALKASGGWHPVRRLAQVLNSRGYGIKFNYLLPGNGTPSIGYSYTDWRRMTIASAEAIAPGCTIGTTVDCGAAKLGRVDYVYSDRPTAGSVTFNAMRLDAVRDAEQNETTLVWSERLLVAESNPAAPGTYQFQNFYTGNAVTQQIDAMNKVWLYRRTTDASGNVLAEIEDPLHAITRYSYVSGKTAPEWIEDPAGRKTKFTYDAMGRTESVETPLGRKTTYSYDSRGNVTNVLETPAPGVATAQSQITTSAVYPPCDESNWKICNKPLSVTDARSQTTEFSYNAYHGGVEAILGPGDGTAGSRSLTRHSYGSFTRAPGVEASSSAAPLPEITLRTGSETCLSSNDTLSYVCPPADSIETSFNYDASTPEQRTQFLLNSVTADPDGIAATTSSRYDIVGNVVQVDGPRSDGDVSTFSYNKNRAMTLAIAPDPDGTGPLAAPETVYDYDPAGQQIAVRSRIGASEIVSSVAYNAAGQIRQISNPLSGVVDLSYDDSGRPLETSQTVDGVVRKTRQVYDSAGRLAETRLGVGTALEQATVTMNYDADGSVISQADANGNMTNYCVDGFGRPVEIRYPSGSVPGTSASCASSPAGSLPPTADFEAFAYDAAGNIEARRLRDGQMISFQYDGLGRVKFKNVPETDRDVTYAYDLIGRLRSASLPGANASLSVSSEYDKLGRVVATTSGGRTLGYSYPLDGQSTSLTWPDQKSATFRSDPLGRLTVIEGLQEPAGAPMLVTYSYDQLSRRSGIVRGNASTLTDYDYSPQGQLATLSHDLTGASADAAWNFTYNEAGQIKTRSHPNGAYAWTGAQNLNRGYERNGLNQYTQSGPLTLGYDRRGNLTSDGTIAYGYDSENRLVAAGSATLTYDAVGRLARFTAGEITTSFLYDGTRLVGEYDGNGALVRRTVYGSGEDEPIAWYDYTGSSDNLYWLYPDERGSIIAVGDREGEIVNYNSYDEFGIPAQTNFGRFQYTGQAWLPEIGLYYYKARFYSADLGRFLQTDPIGYAGGMNLYAYVHNDPINQRDPFGLQAICCVVTGTRVPRPTLSGNFPSGADALAGAGFFNPAQGYGALLNMALRTNPLTWPKGEPPPRAMSCMDALKSVAADSSSIGLPFNSNTFKLLEALGFGSPSAFRLTEGAMARAGAFVAANSGANMLTGLVDLGNGYSRGNFNFGVKAYGGTAIGDPGYLGAILGRSTVYFKGGLEKGKPTGPLVGVDGGTFDYDPANHDWPISWGVGAANSKITRSCPNRQAGVPITGGYIPQ